MELIQRFKDVKLTCFHWSDDWATFVAHRDPRRTEEKVETLLRESDLVFAVSPQLVEKARALVPDAHWLPNATDFDNFSRASLDETELAEEMIVITVTCRTRQTGQMVAGRPHQTTAVGPAGGLSQSGRTCVERTRR